MLPFAALDLGFNDVNRCSIWQHDKSVAKVFMCRERAYVVPGDMAD